MRINPKLISSRPRLRTIGVTVVGWCMPSSAPISVPLSSTNVQHKSNLLAHTRVASIKKNGNPKNEKTIDWFWPTVVQVDATRLRISNFVKSTPSGYHFNIFHIVNLHPYDGSTFCSLINCTQPWVGNTFLFTCTPWEKDQNGGPPTSFDCP